MKVLVFLVFLAVLPGRAAALPSGRESLRIYVEKSHAELRASRPDMFLKKMRRSGESDFGFFRVFPDLFYRNLRASRQAPELLNTARLFLLGDLHIENVELVEARVKGVKRVVPQFNDYDDAGRAPVAADLARLFAGAGLLWDSPRERDKLQEAARRSYLESLDMSFTDWAETIADEKAITEARGEDKDWFHTAGPRVADRALAKRLFKMTGLEPAKRRAFDRMGSGGSSIGHRRYMFASPERKDAWDLKELAPSALEAFTGKRMPQAHRARVGEGIARLRQVPDEARTLRGDGADWVLRRREGEQTFLSREHPVSAARVLGGFAAQVHRSQASAAELEKALRAVTPEVAAASLRYFSRMRQALRALLESGVWDLPRK